MFLKNFFSSVHIEDTETEDVVQELPRIDSKIPKLLEKEKFFSFFSKTCSKVGKNIFNHLMTFLMQASCIWRWFVNLQIIKGDMEIENKYLNGNNYLYETSRKLKLFIYSNFHFSFYSYLVFL